MVEEGARNRLQPVQHHLLLRLNILTRAKEMCPDWQYPVSKLRSRSTDNTPEKSRVGTDKPRPLKLHRTAFGSPQPQPREEEQIPLFETTCTANGVSSHLLHCPPPSFSLFFSLFLFLCSSVFSGSHSNLLQPSQTAASLGSSSSCHIGRLYPTHISLHLAQTVILSLKHSDC